MARTPRFTDSCDSCGVGLTDELRYRQGDKTYCPHCQRSATASRDRTGEVVPDHGFPRTL